MGPALLAAAPSIISGLGTLFGGGPKIPSYSPEDMLKLYNTFFKQLQGGPLGQQMRSNVNLGAQQFNNRLGASQAATGMNLTGIGQIRGAGGGAVRAGMQNDMMAQLMQMAQQMGNQSMQGQTAAGAYKFENPTGLKALMGLIGTSGFPLALMGKGQAQSNSPTTPPFGGTSPWLPNYAGPR